MKIKMELLSDVIFGNGISVPGGEDIAVLSDGYGFPYYKGGTFKGVFREELANYINWNPEAGGIDTIERLLGKEGSDEREDSGKIVFSDFQLSENVRKVVLQEVGEVNCEKVLNMFTNVRTLTSLDDEGIVKNGSLRSLRCVNKDLYFYSEIMCNKEDEDLVKETIQLIKWIGTMRNRGFGKVKISVIE